MGEERVVALVLVLRYSRELVLGAQGGSRGPREPAGSGGCRSLPEVT